MARVCLHVGAYLNFVMGHLQFPHLNLQYDRHRPIIALRLSLKAIDRSVSAYQPVIYLALR